MQQSHCQKDIYRAGFTLVELAIVLMVIGLLVGGILRGSELLHNSRVTKTIQAVKSYQGALVAFENAYNAIPGDFVQATNRLSGCTSGNYCSNGNGDAIIGSASAPFTSYAGRTTVPVLENSMFWKHLSLAHLITGINAGSNPANPAWGQTHPAAPLRGGFEIVYMIGSGTLSGVNTQSGHFLRLQMPLRAGTAFAGGNCPSSGTCDATEAVTGSEAWQIDSKMDDGRPEGGDVLVDDQGGGASSCENKLDARDETPLCVMFFRLK